jgi:hypothetical protein
MKTPLLLLFSLSTLLLGCGKGADGIRPADGATGVEACDAYVARLEACAKKAPAEDRAAHEASIGAARDLLEEKARSDGDKVALGDACKQMADALAERPICN